MSNARQFLDSGDFAASITAPSRSQPEEIHMSIWPAVTAIMAALAVASACSATRTQGVGG
jgi:hypothetical protein